LIAFGIAFATTFVIVQAVKKPVCFLAVEQFSDEPEEICLFYKKQFSHGLVLLSYHAIQ
jgi:hypothetical protein